MPFDASVLSAGLTVIWLAITRTTGMMLVTPFLGRGVVTGLARNGVILALSLPVIVHVWLARPADLASYHLILIMALGMKELLLGVLLGTPVAMTIWGVEAAGAFIDNQRGAAMASLLNPATGSQVSPLGILLAQVYITWLFITGGFLKLLDVLYRSQTLWPAWSFQPAYSPALVSGVLGLLDSVMMLALLLGGPAIIAMFLSELALALVSRFAPQLQVFFLAMPVKSAVGILLLMLSLGIILIQADRQDPSSQGVIKLITGWFP